MHTRDNLFSGYGSLVKTSGHIQENSHMNDYSVDKEFCVYDCVVTHIGRHIMGRSVGNIPVYFRTLNQILIGLTYKWHWRESVSVEVFFL